MPCPDPALHGWWRRVRSRSGSLVAIDRATGAIRWLYLEPPGKDIAEKKKSGGFAASAVIADGVVYAVDLNGRVYAFEK